MTLKLGLATISVLIAIIGFLSVDKLGSIDKHISEMKMEIKESNVKLYDHESRIKLLEEKTK